MNSSLFIFASFRIGRDELARDLGDGHLMLLMLLRSMGCFGQVVVKYMPG